MYKKLIALSLLVTIGAAAVPNITAAYLVDISDTQVTSPKQMYFAASDPALDCVNNKCNLMKKYVNPIINFLTAFVGIAVTIGIISGGIRYASAGDDPQKIGAAKRQISNAILALLALMVLYVALRWLMPSLL